MPPIYKGNCRRLAVRLRPGGSFVKFIYFRRDRSAQNTLTLSNLSHLSTADARREVKSCFSRFGEVEDIVIEPETPGLARFGRIVFRSPASAQAAVEEPFAESEAFVAELILDSDDGGTTLFPPTRGGSDRNRADEKASKAAWKRHKAWCKSQEVSEEELQAACDEVIGNYEKKEAAEAAKRAADRQKGADDDGFITVTYKRKQSNRDEPKLIVHGFNAGEYAQPKQKKKETNGVKELLCASGEGEKTERCRRTAAAFRRGQGASAEDERVEEI